MGKKRRIAPVFIGRVSVYALELCQGCLASWRRRVDRRFVLDEDLVFGREYLMPRRRSLPRPTGGSQEWFCFLVLILGGTRGMEGTARCRSELCLKRERSTEPYYYHHDRTERVQV